MKKIFLVIVLFSLWGTDSFSQDIIQGDQILTLLERSPNDPQVLKFRQQEKFRTLPLNSDSSVEIGTYQDKIYQIKLHHGGMFFFSPAVRNGYYNRRLPLNLRWDMTVPDIERILGEPNYIAHWKMHLRTYYYKGWKLDIAYENDLPVTIAYAKDPNPQPNTLKPEVLEERALIVVDHSNITARANWPVIKTIVNAVGYMEPLIGRDSVHYGGQVIFATPFKVQGFNHSAIKRVKKTGEWVYEAVYTISTADTAKMFKIITVLYNEMQKVLKENTGSDFTHVVGYDKDIRDGAGALIATWTLADNYKTLQQGLPKVKFTLMMSAVNSIQKKGEYDYIFKLIISKSDYTFDFLSWNKPE